MKAFREILRPILIEIECLPKTDTRQLYALMPDIKYLFNLNVSRETKGSLDNCRTSLFKISPDS